MSERGDSIASGLYDQIERAAGELPDGWEIRLCIEHHSGYIQLFDADGCEVEFATNNERLDYTMSDAIDAAIEESNQ